MAGGVVEGPVQVDLVAGAGDAQRAGVVAAEGDEQGALPGRTCSGEQRKRTHERKKKPNKLRIRLFMAIMRKREKDTDASISESSQAWLPVARRQHDQQTAERASPIIGN